MMNLKHEISARELRKFGLALTILLLIIGYFRFIKTGAETLPWLWGIAVFVLIFTILKPVILKPIFRIALLIGHVLGWINTRLILGIIFYLIFTPVSLVMRLTGYDPLNRSFKKDTDTYWIKREKIVKDREQYLKQF